MIRRLVVEIDTETLEEANSVACDVEMYLSGRDLVEYSVSLGLEQPVFPHVGQIRVRPITGWTLIGFWADDDKVEVTGAVAGHVQVFGENEGITEGGLWADYFDVETVEEAQAIAARVTPESYRTGERIDPPEHTDGDGCAIYDDDHHQVKVAGRGEVSVIMVQPGDSYRDQSAGDDPETWWKVTDVGRDENKHLHIQMGEDD